MDSSSVTLYYSFYIRIPIRFFLGYKSLRGARPKSYIVPSEEKKVGFQHSYQNLVYLVFPPPTSEVVDWLDLKGKKEFGVLY